MTQVSADSLTWPCAIGSFKGYPPIYQADIDGTIYTVHYAHGAGWSGLEHRKGAGSLMMRVGPFDSPEEAVDAITAYARSK